MVLAPVKCLHCGSGRVRKNGTSKNGNQRFPCCNESCTHRTFVEYYTCHAYDPNIHSRIFFSIINGSGTRTTAGTPEIAGDTVTEALLWYVNHDYLNNRGEGDIRVEPVTVAEAETDEMWGFAGDKSRRYWQ
jgi:hypothetical protein